MLKLKSVMPHTMQTVLYNGGQQANNNTTTKATVKKVTKSVKVKKSVKIKVLL